MKNIEARAQEYEKKLMSTMDGYLASLETEKDIDKLENYKSHVEHIKGIFDFGCKDYLALTSLPSINYYSENYKGLTKELNEAYLNGFGLENRDELENLLENCTSREEIRNIIWKECFGMEYDLLSKSDVIYQTKKIQEDMTLTPEEKKEEMLKLTCKSGYGINGISNPTYGVDLEELKPIMDEIKKENSKTI